MLGLSERQSYEGEHDLGQGEAVEAGDDPTVRVEVDHAARASSNTPRAMASVTACVVFLAPSFCLIRFV